MKQLPLVSIVVPVYNVDEYLPKCIKSLLVQTYTNLEILLVDDGSTDISGKLCNTFAAANERVKVIHKKNGGLSDARNVGLKHSTGSLVCFVDSDDYVKKDYVSKLFKAMDKTGADIVVCGFYRASGKTLNKIPFSSESLGGLDAIKRMLASDDVGEVVAWNKLYIKRIFQENCIEYPKGKICEDVFTTYKLFNKANKVVFIDDPLYFYVQRKTSITGVNFSRKHLDGIEGTDQIILWAKKNYPDLIEPAYASRAKMTMHLSGEIYKSPRPDTETLNSFTRWIRTNWYVILFNKFISFRKKLTLFLLAIGGNTYSRLRNAYENAFSNI